MSRVRFGQRIAVVIPAYNEQAHIADTLRGVPDFVDRIFVVDDGSGDATAAAARAAGGERTRVVQHPRNRGVGAALATGYQLAFRDGADAVAVMAGDGQMDPDDLEPLLKPVLLAHSDYSYGDRLSHPEVRTRMPALRWLGNSVLSRLTSLILGTHIADSQCGYTVLGRRAAALLELERLWPTYGYPNEMLSRLLSTGARITSVTVRPVYADEVSGVGWHHALLVIPFVLARAFWRRMRVAAVPRRGGGRVTLPY